MTTTILLDNVTLSETGAVEIRINRSFTIAISAEQARRTVNRWLLMEVSMSFVAESPTLALAASAVWRVPVVYTASHVGRVGLAGTVDVDVNTGEIFDSPEVRECIFATAKSMAEKLPPFQLREVANEYVVKNVQTTHNATIGISATRARRTVNGWLMLKVSTSMLGDSPSLVVAERVVWRVPILFTATHVGPVGTIGSVDVDVESGEILPETANIEEMYCRIEELAKTLPPFKLREIPEEYLAKDLPVTPIEPRGKLADFVTPIPSGKNPQEIIPELIQL